MALQSNAFQSESEANYTGGVASPLPSANPAKAVDVTEEKTPIDPLGDDLLTLAEAAAICPKVNGKRPHVATILRWCKKGTRGVTLEYVQVGSRVMTTRAALLEFFERSRTHQRRGKTTVPGPFTRTEKRRARDLEVAWQKLKRHGL